MSFDYERWKAEQFHTMEQEATSTVPFPNSILWAGTIWVTVGVLALLSVAVLSSQTGTIRTPGSALGGLLFIYGGVRAIRGTSPGTVGSGIGSILLGMTWVVAGILFANSRLGSSALLLVGVGFGGAFILAGFLALAGRSSYQKWRAARAGAELRSRRG